MISSANEAALANYLSTFLTPERHAKMQAVLGSRTRYLTVVLENIFQPHNASAVLRSCDALGIQDVHIVEQNNKYKVNPDIALGAAQWLNLHHYKGPEGLATSYAALRASGYRIVATSPHKRACPLHELDLEKGPLALVMGTELDGLTQEALETADEYVYIPMYGFVESFNVSVSAAICLQDLSQRLRSSGLNWPLDETARGQVWLSWLRQSIKSAAALERRFWHDHQTTQ